MSYNKVTEIPLDETTLEKLAEFTRRHERGTRASIVIDEGDLNHGPATVEIIVLQDCEVVYGYEDDNYGPFWEIGDVEEAIAEAEAEYEAMIDVCELINEGDE